MLLNVSAVLSICAQVSRQNDNLADMLSVQCEQGQCLCAACPLSLEDMMEAKCVGSACPSGAHV